MANQTVIKQVPDYLSIKISNHSGNAKKIILFDPNFQDPDVTIESGIDDFSLKEYQDGFINKKKLVGCVYVHLIDGSSKSICNSVYKLIKPIDNGILINYIPIGLSPSQFQTSVVKGDENNFKPFMIDEKTVIEFVLSEKTSISIIFYLADFFSIKGCISKKTIKVQGGNGTFLGTIALIKCPIAPHYTETIVGDKQVLAPTPFYILKAYVDGSTTEALVSGTFPIKELPVQLPHTEESLKKILTWQAEADTPGETEEFNRILSDTGFAV